MITRSLEEAVTIAVVGCSDGCGFRCEIALGALSATSCPDCDGNLEIVSGPATVSDDGP